MPITVKEGTGAAAGADGRISILYRPRPWSRLSVGILIGFLKTSCLSLQRTSSTTWGHKLWPQVGEGQDTRQWHSLSRVSLCSQVFSTAKELFKSTSRSCGPLPSSGRCCQHTKTWRKKMGPWQVQIKVASQEYRFQISFDKIRLKCKINTNCCAWYKFFTCEQICFCLSFKITGNSLLRKLPLGRAEEHDLRQGEWGDNGASMYNTYDRKRLPAEPDKLRKAGCSAMHALLERSPSCRNILWNKNGYRCKLFKEGFLIMTEQLSVEQIAGKIYFIRGIKVMLDQDLAELYSVETK